MVEPIRRRTGTLIMLYPWRPQGHEQYHMTIAQCECRKEHLDKALQKILIFHPFLVSQVAK